jgi:hypothetical protein
MSLIINLKRKYVMKNNIIEFTKNLFHLSVKLNVILIIYKEGKNQAPHEEKSEYKPEDTFKSLAITDESSNGEGGGAEQEMLGLLFNPSDAEGVSE